MMGKIRRRSARVGMCIRRRGAAVVASGRESCNSLYQDVDTKIECIRILNFIKEH